MSGEKVSINMTDETLSKIDLLVEDGFYSNRSDFVNRAAELLLEKEDHTLQKLLEIHSQEKISERQWFIGIQSMGTAYLEKVKERGLHLTIKGCGILYFEKDIDPELIYGTIRFISSKIRIFGSDAVRDHFHVEKPARRRKNKSNKDV